MPVDVTINSLVNVIDFLFDPFQNAHVIPMLFGVPLVKAVQEPHQWASDNGNRKRNPPLHDLSEFFWLHQRSWRDTTGEKC